MLCTNGSSDKMGLPDFGVLDIGTGFENIDQLSDWSSYCISFTHKEFKNPANGNCCFTRYSSMILKNLLLDRDCSIK
jgi:hypothetical protein